ncbi:hypothetical protein CO038_01010 [Candidatus Pacearchaeota archaeon CG_4_9_14_0_2_um_filter_39_13]|nr:hypothetical protein [Candidatus Pacearchaeota archaeon]OIO43107.1 MAG: hypothetical protein AUJ64_02905 [Candidatus Pacearchaeota archaeon CG1_02_39_14]PJC44955.1 MAG: hypothetical protein CO038_01010 [Candidatus Pacearchaeota archaeon CG_4_9_14_0_2_um_filter_39_13]
MKEEKENKLKREKRNQDIRKNIMVSGKTNIIVTSCLSVFTTVIALIFSRSLLITAVTLFSSIVLVQIYFAIKQILKEAERLKKMESSFPDFIQLVSSNLRAGMTIDKALLLSSRKEFAPLDEEILHLGKDLVTGKEISTALEEMAKRVGSEKIIKTINLIVSGIRSGGNLATLLEQTASSMRERNFVEKRAASNVLMYVIFIFFAVAIGAPILFGLSSVLVEILTDLLSTLPELDASVSVPFTLTSISISVTFITYFSLAFIIATDIMASFVLGLVSKGEEKEGLKYLLPLALVSIVIFLIVRVFLRSYFGGLF